MKIVIPSRSRQFQLVPLLEQLGGCGFDIVVYNPESQHDAYAETLRRLSKTYANGQVELRTVPDDWRLLRKVKYAGEQMLAEGAESWVLMDDDVGFLIRKSSDDWRLRAQTPKETARMLRVMELLLSFGRWSHVSVSSREGNNRLGTGAPHELLSECTRAMRVVGWRSADIMALEHERAEGRGDLDCTLQSLRDGKPNLLLGYWAQGQTATNAPGGCADWRTREVSDDAARRLQAHHPDFVSLRNKHNTSGPVEMRDRIEVTIQWRRAYASSRGRLLGALDLQDLGKRLGVSV